MFKSVHKTDKGIKYGVMGWDSQARGLVAIYAYIYPGEQPYYTFRTSSATSHACRASAEYLSGRFPLVFRALKIYAGIRFYKGV